MKPTFVIDGSRCTTLEAFFDEVERVLIPGVSWGRNLDAFNDILRGGFGTPDGGFVLIWRNSAKARTFLNQAETGLGPTLFDDIVEIIQIHTAQGPEAEDGVILVLE